MSRSISSATRADITAPQSALAMLTMIEISSDELDDSLYFVRNNVDVVSNSITYSAINFSVKMPSQEDSSVGDTSITISGVNRQVIEAIRSINNAPDVTMFLVRNDTPDTVELGPFYFKLRSVSFDKHSVTGSLLHEYTLRNNISTITITNQNFPGLFA